MSAKKRKILLIFDNCTDHSVVEEFKSVEVQYLSSNTTLALQPMDQGCNKNSKSNYRKMAIKRMIAITENKESYVIYFLSVLHLAKAFWDEVTKEAITRCFRHASFKTTEEYEKNRV